MVARARAGDPRLLRAQAARAGDRGHRRRANEPYGITLMAIGYPEQGASRKHRLGLRRVTDLRMSALNSAGLGEHEPSPTWRSRASAAPPRPAWACSNAQACCTSIAWAAFVAAGAASTSTRARARRSSGARRRAHARAARGRGRRARRGSQRSSGRRVTRRTDQSGSLSRNSVEPLAPHLVATAYTPTAAAMRRATGSEG